MNIIIFTITTNYHIELVVFLWKMSDLYVVIITTNDLYETSSEGKVYHILAVDDTINNLWLKNTKNVETICKKYIKHIRII